MRISERQSGRGGWTAAAAVVSRGSSCFQFEPPPVIMRDLLLLVSYSGGELRPALSPVTHLHERPFFCFFDEIGGHPQASADLGVGQRNVLDAVFGVRAHLVAQLDHASLCGWQM